MIHELVLFLVGFVYTVVCVGGGAFGYHYVRKQIPFRVPTNRQRVENAETDLTVMEVSNKKATARFEGQAIELRGAAKIEEVRREIESSQPLALEAGDGEPGMPNYGEMIFEGRTRRGLTLKTVSLAADQRSKYPNLGISARRLSEIEQGKSPTIVELQTLAEILGLKYTPPLLGVPAISRNGRE